MKVLVTGATGFIGRHLCQHLNGLGHHVRVLVRPSSPARRLERLGEVETAVGDVTVPRTLAEALDGVDAVAHLAGVTAAARNSTYQRVNAEGTGALARACAGRNLSRLVFLSSLAAQGPSQPGSPHVDPGREAPVNGYGRSKLAAESALRVEADSVPVTVLRPGFVYGPYDPEMAAWARLASRGLLPVVRDAELSFVHVDDLCRLIARLLEPGPCSFGPYFISDGPPCRMSDLADLLERALRSKPAIRLPLSTRLLGFIAPSIERLSGAARTGPLLARTLRELAGGGWACRPERAQAELAFEPSRSFDVGIAETMDWYRRHQWI